MPLIPQIMVPFAATVSQPLSLKQWSRLLRPCRSPYPQIPFGRPFVQSDLQSACIEYQHLQCEKSGMFHLKISNLNPQISNHESILLG